MIALIGTILGFLSTVAPLALQYFTRKEDNAQLIRLETLKQQGRREEIAGQVDIKNAEADIKQSDHIYEYANSSSGYRFVDAMAALIRPYITFVFFHLFLLIKASLFVYGVNRGYDLGQLAVLIWDDNTSGIFGAIMGFWFGNRLLRKQALPAMLEVTRGK